MLKVDVYNHKGEKTGSLSLPKEIFGQKINNKLLAQAVRVYRGRKRKASAKTKSRSEVVASKRKIWRQKGTGRARHGSRNAPIFVKGGVAHGPTGKQNFTKKLSKKMKKAALKSALATKAGDKKISNLKNVRISKADSLNAYEILQKNYLFLEKEAIEKIKQVFSKTKKEK
jgi:large subunit ribosomal protein L4